MNVAIRRVFWGVVVLFALLVVYTARWSVIESDSLKRSSLNKIPALREWRDPRGPILTTERGTIARSVRSGSGDDVHYSRRYPLDVLFGHPAGYSYVTRGGSGLEKYYDGQLVGRKDEFVSVLDSLLGRKREAQSLVTALDEPAQRVARQALAGRVGSVVVIEPRTGRVPVYVSVPGYDPNDVRDSDGYARLNSDDGSPLFDRVATSAYPPGSTFKVVTATAAIDTGAYRPSSVVNGDSPKQISGTPLENSGGKSWGDITLTDALTHSVNTVWAQVGEDVGSDTMIEYMKRFGFYEKPPIDLPSDQLAASGLREHGELLPDETPIDVGRVAIGQERLAVTPLQMATVAATVANGGLRVAPRLAVSFEDRTGRTKDRVGVKRITRVMSAATARKLNEMMQNVIREGTGTAAALAGINSAGKTGTAERARGNQAWFIGFAPAEHPRYAIAVTVEQTTGQGGTVAAPIARQVLQNLLR
ncbi:MAG: penicillin-binding protein 2 [Actinobacteria bacterium]|nr:penicillin-binding protein 2 [Actinomycetota bacterium]